MNDVHCQCISKSQHCNVTFQFSERDHHGHVMLIYVYHIMIICVYDTLMLLKQMLLKQSVNARSCNFRNIF